MSTQQVLDMIASDPWRMHALTLVDSLNLPDCWIGGGFVRNRVWDVLHGIETPVNDIDVVYFDTQDIRPERDKHYESLLSHHLALPWSVKNQARMHTKNNNAPYLNTHDAIRHWIEIPTCIAVRLHDHALELLAPHGTHDLVNLVVKPSPQCPSLDVYRERTTNKGWKERWPQLHIYHA